MNFDTKLLKQGQKWYIAWYNIRGKENVALNFNNETAIDSDVLSESRKHAVTHLYCSDIWAGGDLSVFKPIADIIKRITLPCEKSTKIVGLNVLKNLKEISISGDLTEVDFTRFENLANLSVNENCKGGNWHLCQTIEDLVVNVSLSNFKRLKSLKKLRRLGCGRGLKSFQGIHDLPLLKELRVSGCHLPSLVSFGKHSEIHLLLLNLLPKITNLMGIEGLSNLENLEVTQCGALRDVSALAKLSKLKNLELAFCPNIKTLDNVILAKSCNVNFAPDGKVSDGF